MTGRPEPATSSSTATRPLRVTGAPCRPIDIGTGVALPAFGPVWMMLIFTGLNAGLLLAGLAAHGRRRRRLKALALGIEPLERALADRGVPGRAAFFEPGSRDRPPAMEGRPLTPPPAQGRMMKSKPAPPPAVSPEAGSSPTRNDVVDAGSSVSAARDSLRASLRCGPLRLRAEVEHTPAGLLALGACVTSILCGAAAIVWVSTAAPRRHPLATALALRRIRGR